VRDRSAESRELKLAFILIGSLVGLLVVIWLGLVISDLVSPPSTEEELIRDAATNPDVVQSGRVGTQSDAGDDEDQMPLWFTAVVILGIVGLLAVGVVAMVRLGRQRGPRFSELDPEEQERRRQAADSLRRLSEP
jgi:hypothetical protein